MHQESNTREATPAALTPFSVMSGKSADEFGVRAEGPGIRSADSTQRPARVVTPAVERVLEWYRRRGG